MEKILTEHPQYQKYISSYKKTTDCAAGQEEIKNSPRLKTYLPPLPAHERDKKNGSTLYNIYSRYAVYFNAVGRAVDGYRGMAFAKRPIFSGTGLEDFITDVTRDGDPIDAFSTKLFTDCVAQYRPGILVDLPYNTDADDLELTVKQAQNRMKPYFAFYPTDSILDWREERIGGSIKTTFVKLLEHSTQPSRDDRFSYNEIERIRVLSLTPDGNYLQEVFENGKNGFDLVFSVEPVINGQKLDYIPFVTCSERGLSWELDYSPVNDLADMAVAYFRNSASYQNGLLLAGNPTFCTAGLLVRESQNRDGEIVMGSSSVLQFDTDGKWGFAQIGTDGLGELHRSMTELKQQMALVGLRLLQSDSNGVESAQTAAIHRSGENGILANIASSVGMAITEALKIVAEWMGLPTDDISYNLNTDYDVSEIDTQKLVALQTALQAGIISPETFFYNLKRGEIYADGWTFDNEMESINKNTIDNYRGLVSGSIGK